MLSGPESWKGKVWSFQLCPAEMTKIVALDLQGRQEGLAEYYSRRLARMTLFHVHYKVGVTLTHRGRK